MLVPRALCRPPPEDRAPSYTMLSQLVGGGRTSFGPSPTGVLNVKLITPIVDCQQECSLRQNQRRRTLVGGVQPLPKRNQKLGRTSAIAPRTRFRTPSESLSSVIDDVLFSDEGVEEEENEVEEGEEEAEEEEDDEEEGEEISSDQTKIFFETTQERNGLSRDAAAYVPTKQGPQFPLLGSTVDRRTVEGLPLGKDANGADPVPLSAEASDYLQSKGIDVSLLADVLLPSSLQILQERIDFLEALGVNAPEVVNRFPPLLGCSVARNFVPVLSFLEGISISREEVPQLITSYPEILYRSVVMDVMPHIDFLLGLGIDKSDLGKVILAFPQVFSLKLEESMSTSVAYLVGIGVTMRAIGPIITKSPSLLSRAVASDILPKVEFLQSLGLSRKQVADIIEEHPRLLALDLVGQMKVALAGLAEVGVGELQFGEMVAVYPPLLALDVRQALEERRDWIASRLGVEGDELAALIRKMPQLLVIDTHRADEKMEFLESWGFKGHEVALMVQRCPQILGLHIGKSLGPKLSFLLDTSRRKLQELVEYPVCLMCSLTEIETREKSMNDAGLRRSLPWILGCSAEDFRVRLQAEILSLQRAKPWGPKMRRR